MFKPFSVFIGLRYSLTRKRNFLLSFVSLISMLGVSIGVLILIVALSVMNGSISLLRTEALKSVPHVIVSGESFGENWREEARLALTSADVLAVAPFLEGEATIRHQGNNSFVRLRGVDPLLEANVVNNDSTRYAELFLELAETQNGIILGSQLARELEIDGRSDVSVTALSSLLTRSLSDTQGFVVIGFADFGIYGNNNVALVNLSQAQALFVADPGMNLQLRLKVADVLRAKKIAGSINFAESDLDIQPWNETQASLFNALELEKILTSFMLLMIVVIGAVNIVSTLVMVVSDKTADIAIMRTMGASSTTIMKIFIVQGLIAGVIGTLAGAILGVLLADNITNLSLLLEQFLNSVFSGANIYLISHLQTRIDLIEVLYICAAALLVSFLATLYPAYRASKIQPAEVLRYE
jgi:lipoprotein-releasing system permease protein